MRINTSILSTKKHVKKVSIYYNDWHEKYLHYYGDTFQAHRPKNIEELHSYLFRQIGFCDGENVLDAGCGVCGPAISFAKKCNIHIEALTNSDKQILEANHLITKESLNSRIHTNYGDFHELDKIFPPESFDRIYFLESFGHAKNKRAVIESAWKVLKYNGTLYIKDYFSNEITGNIKRKWLMKRAIKRMNKLYSYKLSDLYFTLKILRKLDSRIRFIGSPQYTLSNESVVNVFEKENKIDLFNSDYMPIIVDPFEIKIEKIIRDVRIY